MHHSIHCSFQQMLMNVTGIMTVIMAASTNSAPTSVCVPKGTCCKMDGVVNVSQFRAPLMMSIHVTP